MNNEFLGLYSETNVGHKRSVNEDFLGYDETPNGYLYVVCDGMGGHVGGATASQLAVNSIISFFKKEPFEDIYEALSNAIKFANKEIYLHASNNPELKGMGTTCTVLIAREPEIFIAHVGDSRIYLNSDSKLYRLTKDHSYVQELVDQGVIKDEEAENHPKKNQILRALGIHEMVEPTVYRKPIHPKKGDKFLLCSDGLNGEINDNTIENVFNSHKEINNVGSELIVQALDAGGSDNITIEIIEVLSSPFEKSDFPNYNPPKLVNTDPTNLVTTIVDETIVEKPKKIKLNTIQLLLSGIIIVLIAGGRIYYLNDSTQDNSINTEKPVKVNQSPNENTDTEKEENPEDLNNIEDTPEEEIKTVSPVKEEEIITKENNGATSTRIQKKKANNSENRNETAGPQTNKSYLSEKEEKEKKEKQEKEKDKKEKEKDKKEKEEKEDKKEKDKKENKEKEEKDKKEKEEKEKKEKEKEEKEEKDKKEKEEKEKKEKENADAKVIDHLETDDDTTNTDPPKLKQ